MSTASLNLSSAAARVLGCLLEKESTTPEYYPLSLLALMNACNQRSSRHPVMDLGEDEVRMALHQLEDAGLAAAVRGTESRVAKFAHHIGEVYNLRRGEHAVLCVLLLRGPQTPGELRGRTDRLHRFVTLDEVESALQQLAQREPPLARALPREPGSREVRYRHLLSAVLEETTAPQIQQAQTQQVQTQETRSVASGRGEDRIAQLEAEIAELRARIVAMEEKLAQVLG